MPAFLGRLLLTGVAGRRNKGPLQGIPYLLQNRESRLEKEAFTIASWRTEFYA